MYVHFWQVPDTNVYGCSACANNSFLSFVPIYSVWPIPLILPKGILKVHRTVHLTTALLSPCCLDLHWCRGVCDGGTLSREGLPGFGSTSLQRPEILGSGQPGFQSDLNNMHMDKVALIYQCKLCAPSHGTSGNKLTRHENITTLQWTAKSYEIYENVCKPLLWVHIHTHLYS